MTDIFDTVWEVPRHMRAAMQSTFYLSSKSFDNPSPWTGERSPYGPFVQLFIAEITPASAPSPAKAKNGEVDWRQWQGFITRLRGTSGKLRIVDYYRMRPVYDAKNSPALSSWSNGSTWSDGAQWESGPLPPFAVFDEDAREGDTTAVLRGLPVSTSDVISPSDLGEGRPNGVQTTFSNLYETVHCAKTNAAGKTRIYFQPGLRQGFKAGDMWALRYPTGVFRLADNAQGVVTRTMGNLGSLGFKLIEDLGNG